MGVVEPDPGRFLRTVLYRLGTSVCMGGGPGCDLARGRKCGLRSIGVAVGISACEESNSSGVGIMEAGITFSPE